MAPQNDRNDTAQHFQVGSRCLLTVLDQRFLVGVLHATVESLRTSFPLRGFPPEGTRVELEFHDELSYTSYEATVLKAPTDIGDGLLLSRPPAANPTTHRTDWRVPADFEVRFKGHVHPRRYTAPVIDISGGGLLMLTAAALSIGDNLELTLPIAGITDEILTARVVHVGAGQADQEGVQVGLELVSPDPVITGALSRYIWQRLRALYPGSLPELREQMDDTEAG